MRKLTFLSIALAILVVVSCIIFIFLVWTFDNHNNTIDGEFDFNLKSSYPEDSYLDDSYCSIIQNPNFQSDTVIGKIESPSQLRREAQRIWISIYGLQILRQKPYEVLYDSKNGIWLVRGTISQDSQGGTAHILVDNETGKVLAVWHYS